MKKLVILDQQRGTVHFYDVRENMEVDEWLIEYLGFRSNDCNWMVHDSLEIIYHKEVL